MASVLEIALFLQSASDFEKQNLLALKNLELFINDGKISILNHIMKNSIENQKKLLAKNHEIVLNILTNLDNIRKINIFQNMDNEEIIKLLFSLDIISNEENKAKVASNSRDTRSISERFRTTRRVTTTTRLQSDGRTEDNGTEGND